MTKASRDALNPLGVPPPQHNLQVAVTNAFVALSDQSTDQLEWLGVTVKDDRWSVPVLADVMTVEPAQKSICVSDGKEIKPSWRVLTLHYLGVGVQPEDIVPAVTFADIRGAQTYAPIYQQRVINRLCATVGRNEQDLRKACLGLGGREVTGSADVSFDFEIYPRVHMKLLWYTGDDEFAPSASLLLPSNIDAYFCLEDIVALSEELISRLSGRPF